MRKRELDALYIIQRNYLDREREEAEKARNSHQHGKYKITQKRRVEKDTPDWMG